MRVSHGHIAIHRRKSDRLEREVRPDQNLAFERVGARFVAPGVPLRTPRRTFVNRDPRRRDGVERQNHSTEEVVRVEVPEIVVEQIQNDRTRPRGVFVHAEVKRVAPRGRRCAVNNLRAEHLFCQTF